MLKQIYRRGDGQTGEVLQDLPGPAEKGEEGAASGETPDILNIIDGVLDEGTVLDTERGARMAALMKKIEEVLDNPEELTLSYTQFGGQ